MNSPSIVGTVLLVAFAWSYLFLLRPLVGGGARGMQDSYLIVGELFLVTAAGTAGDRINGLVDADLCELQLIILTLL